MSRRPIVLAAILVTAAAAAAIPAVVHAAVPSPVQAVVDATGTGMKGVWCSDPWLIRSLTRKKGVAGIADPKTREIRFDREHVCKAIIKYQRTGKLTTQTVDAIATVGHEAAHLRSVRSESGAECLGARFAYAYLRRKGAFARYVASDIRRYLLDDSHRRPAYKLRGTCFL